MQMAEIVLKCEANGCTRLADWEYVRERLYLCEFHGGTEPADGWTRITPVERRPTQ